MLNLQYLPPYPPPPPTIPAPLPSHLQNTIKGLAAVRKNTNTSQYIQRLNSRTDVPRPLSLCGCCCTKFMIV